MSRKLIVHSEEHTNPATGEITTIRKTVSIATRGSDEFFMIFIKFISGFFELKSTIDMKLLVRFCQMSEFNTGVVLLPTGTRKELLTEFGIGNAHFSNALNRLKKANLLTGEQGKYQLNPIVVWKGDIKTRDQIIQAKGLDFKLNFTSKGFD